MEVTDDSEALIETLKSRGWCFRDMDEIKTTIMIQSAILGDTCTVNSLESELANMDFRSIGGKSLPDPSLLRKSSSLIGPKVLQISSVRDVSRSSIEDSSSSHSRRLFKLNLTDGHSEITAVEYTHIPSIPDDVIPGTKVCLQSKAAIRNGIVCLNPKVITVLGGVVQSLYEEWQMNKKYSGVSRATLRLSKENDTDGPPPFEKFQIGRTTHNLAQQDNFVSTSQNTGPTVDTGGISKIRQMGKPPSQFKGHLDDLKKDSSSEKTEEKPSTSDMRPKEDNLGSTSQNTGPTADTGGISKSRQMGKPPSQLKNHLDDLKKDSSSDRTEEKPSTSDMRPKEVAECIPIQNQAAAQKLLQKMAHPNQDDRHSRGRKQRGKGKQEELPTFTLAEYEQRKSEAKLGGKGKQEEFPTLTLTDWEKRKSEANPQIRANNPNISRDEDLAWQLQNQFDLENHLGQVERGPHEADVKNIKMSMFNYEKNGESAHEAGYYRGRGRGRGSGGGGRGRGRGRGRGKGEGRGRGRFD